MPELDPVPSWLELPPASEIDPPMDALADRLPLEKLRWEDFERLCLTLARLEADVVGARQYGTPGQAQAGIDLYARVRGGDQYRVYQCKKVEEFSPVVIREVVDLFLAGTWAARARDVVLCTSDSVRSTQRAEEVETQTRRLATHGITLLVWAREDISDGLRAHPFVVFQFFGPAWVERFCGRNQLDQLVAARTRLEPSQVISLRAGLRRLYGNVFTTHDPGLLIAQQDSPLGLQDRYVVPDLFERRVLAEGISEVLVSSAASGSTAESAAEDMRDLEERTGGGETKYARWQGNRPSSRGSFPQLQRTTLEAFFAGEPNAKYVVLGGPGSGKSALLRFVASDLLSDDPRVSGLARAWGLYLPVWIPFGGWVDQTRQAGRPVALSEMLRTWLALWDETRLWPLFADALEDRRLLLLVDGLDEWSSEDSAHISLAQLNVFSAQRSAPVVATSRPHGFQRLAAELPAWKLGELAPLTRPQQAALAQSWFNRWLRVDSQSLAGDTNSDALIAGRAAELAHELVEDLARLPDLEDLAQVPLLLSVLILLRYQNAALPDDRFQAYEALVKELISVWPRRRRAAALISRSAELELRDEERESAYAFLAFRTSERSPSGLIEAGRARADLEEFLRNDGIGLGLSEADANRLGRDLLDVGEFVSGILVKRSPRELGFYHRALQEFLAARHIASLAERDQLELVRRHAVDAIWREIILSLLWMTSSQGAAAAIVAELRHVEAGTAVPERFHVTELLAEAAVGPFACPTNLARELAGSAIQAIADSWWMPHRERLLGILLRGIRHRRLRVTILPRVRQWFPKRSEYWDSLLPTIGQWPEAGDVQAVLWQNLLEEEDSGAQLEAARLIAQRPGRESELRDKLLLLARSPVTVRTRAVALLAVLDGWGINDALRQALAAPGSTQSPEVLFLENRLALLDGTNTPSLVNSLLSLIREVDYFWRPLVRTAILKHLPGNIIVRDSCLGAVRHADARPPAAPTIDFDDAWYLLLEGYPQDERVVDALVEELQGPYPHFRSVNWSVLARSFRGNPQLIEALDRWIESNPEYREPQIAGAALVGLTPIGKRALLRNLDSNVPFWSAGALLDGWGMQDLEVREALTSKAGAANPVASLIAHYLPRIIEDADRCYERLLELLRDPSAHRTDLIISGLHQLRRIAGNAEVVNAVIARASEDTSWPNPSAMTGQTIIDAANVPGVRELALAQLSNPDGAHAAVASAFGGDPVIRQRLLEMVTPLPRRLRMITAGFLRDLRRADEEVTSICKDYAWDNDNEVSTATAIAYYRQRRLEGEVAAGEITSLRQTVRSYGPTHEERRQAAAAALIELGKARLLDEEYETIGDRVPVRVGLGNFQGPNRPLIKLILERWAELEQQFDGHVLERFSTRLGGTLEQQLAKTRDWVAPNADEYPEIALALLRFAEQATPVEIGSQLLQFLARHRPGSLLVRDRCLAALHRTDEWEETPRLWETAADILAVQFQEDDALWGELSAELVQQPRSGGLIVALSRARPGDVALARIAAGRDAQLRVSLPAYVYFRLLCATADGGTLVELLQANLPSVSPDSQRVYGLLYRPLIERLRRDETLTASLRTLAGQPGPRTLRVALLSLLASVPGALRTEELRTELREEMDAAELGDGARPTLVYDLQSGTLRPFVHVLLSTLERTAR